MTTLYVGNLPFSAADSEVRDLFEQHVRVTSLSLIGDRDFGRPHGPCLVAMSPWNAGRAISSLDEFALGTRPSRVVEAHDRASRPTPDAPPHGGGRC